VLRSLWFEGRDAVARPPLDRDIAADVVVVGAGIVGLTTAFLLEREGMDVTVLEMRRVAAGATGYNTAKLSSLHGLTYTQLANSLGRDMARMYGGANEAGIARVFELAEELGIDCDLARKPNFTYSEDAAEVPQLREEAQLAFELGLPASYVEELDLPCQTIRIGHVVAVEEGEILTTGGIDAGVAPGGDPPVPAVADETDARVPIGPHDVWALVGRAVVDHNDLEIRERLGEYAVDGFLDVRAPVVDRDHDADPRIGHGSA